MENTNSANTVTEQQTGAFGNFSRYFINAYAINASDIPKVSGPKVRGKSHVKRIFARLSYPFIVLIVGLFAAAFTQSLLIVVVFLALAAVISAYFGWQSLGEYQIFSSTPVSKIEGAADGLAEIEAKFVPERENSFPTPVEGNRCIYYKVELHYKTSGKNAHDWTEWSYERGSPSLLYDGTGYLNADFTTAELGYYINLYPIRDSKWFDMSFRQNIFNALNNSVQTGRLDITPFSSTIKIGSDNDRKAKVEYGDNTSPRRPTGYYLIEYYLPSDISYFTIANVSDTGKQYNNAPLKTAQVDPRSGIFSIVPVAKSKAMSKLRTYMFVEFALAILCFGGVVLTLNLLSS